MLHGGTYRVGVFAGYQPAIPNSVEGITQDNQWQSLRLGLDGSALIGDRFTFSAEAVWFPYAILNGVDDHLLRADLGGGHS